MGRRRSCGRRIWRSTRGWCWRDTRRRRNWRTERVRWRSLVFDVLERFGAELAMFAALALNCASGTGDFMFVPYLRLAMRWTALHFLAAVFFLTLVFIRHLAQCGICIAMEFQFYHPIPTTKPYLTQDLHPTKPTNTLTPHIRPASTGLSVLTPTDKARIISAERHFRTRPGPPTSQIPHLNRRSTRKSRPLESFAIRISIIAVHTNRKA
jgi:hypothetical protein